MSASKLRPPHIARYPSPYPLRRTTDRRGTVARPSSKIDPRRAAAERRVLGGRADHEARDVGEEHQRDAVGVAEGDEAGRLLARVGVERSGEHHRLVGDDADRATVQAGERRHEVRARTSAGARRSCPRRRSARGPSRRRRPAALLAGTTSIRPRSRRPGSSSVGPSGNAASAFVGTYDSQRRVASNASCSDATPRWAMPLRSTCTAAPPRSSLLMSSPVDALTSAGPAMPIVDTPRTMTTKSARPAKFVFPANPSPRIEADDGHPAGHPHEVDEVWAGVGEVARVEAVLDPVAAAVEHHDQGEPAVAGHHAAALRRSCRRPRRCCRRTSRSPAR